jgi:hypothetical protein
MAAPAQQATPLPWDSIHVATLSINELRALVAPPLYDPRQFPLRISLLDTTRMYGGPVVSDWLVGTGTGFAESVYFLVFTWGTPATISFTAVSERHEYHDARGANGMIQDSLVDQIRTCLYALDDSAIAYVALHQPNDGTADREYDRPSGVYRIGPHSNMAEAQVYRIGSVPSSLMTRCDRDTPSLPTWLE